MLLIILIVLLLVGIPSVGFHVGGPAWGGGGLGLVLVILLILYLVGALR